MDTLGALRGNAEHVVAAGPGWVILWIVIAIIVVLAAVALIRRF
jgi:hypothetical protein